MLRIICKESYMGHAVHVGGPIETKTRTFDVHLPGVDVYLRGAEGVDYIVREVIGVELLPFEDEQG